MESALQQFVLLAKSSKGPALARVVKQALEANGVYNFGELLYSPNVKALVQDPEQKKWVELLEIFSFGTLTDYRNATGLPEIGPKEQKKLKELTVLSLASGSRVLAYDDLLRDLELQDVRALEDMLIELITTGLLTANLDQRQRQVSIQDCAPRDVRMPTDLDKMLATLKQWAENANRVQEALNEMEKTANNANFDKLKHEKEQEETRKKVQEQIAHDMERRGGMEGFGGGMDEFGMDEMDMGMGMSMGMGGGAAGFMGMMRGAARAGSRSAKRPRGAAF